MQRRWTACPASRSLQGWSTAWAEWRRHPQRECFQTMCRNKSRSTAAERLSRRGSLCRHGQPGHRERTLTCAKYSVLHSIAGPEPLLERLALAARQEQARAEEPANDRQRPKRVEPGGERQI